MPTRDLSFPVFDADDHFCEPHEALTQFLPERRKGVIDDIPNHTFEVVAGHGAQQDYVTHASGGIA